MLIRFTIGRKLGLGFGVLLIAILVNGALTYFTLVKTKELNEKIAKTYTPSISSLKDLNLLVIRSKTLIGTWLVEDKDDHPSKDELRNVHEEEFPALKEELKVLIRSWDQRNRMTMDSVFLGIDSIMDLQHAIMKKYNNPDVYWEPYQNADERVTKKESFEKGLHNRTIGDILVKLNKAIKIQETNAGIKSQEMEELFDQLQTYVLYLGLILLISGILIAYFTISSIVNPVNNLKEVLLIMGQGVLPDKEIQERQDEIGEMSAALNSLVTALKRTSSFAKEIGEGNFDSEYSALSGEDTLGNSLLIMRDNLKLVAEEDSRRNWSTGGLAKFGEILRRNSDNLSNLSTALISELVKYLGANQGGVFVINDDDEDDLYMELTGCYAWDRLKYLDQKIGVGDSLVGQSWQEKSTLYITDVPDDYVNITSGLGDANPKCLLIVPMIVNEEVYGVLELAGFYEFEDYKVKFAERVAETTASTISSVKVNEKTKQLLEQAQMASAQMRTQEEELRKNQDEMELSQDDMEQKLEESELKIQQLKRSRDQLKEENEILQNVLLKTTKELERFKSE